MSRCSCRHQYRRVDHPGPAPAPGGDRLVGSAAGIRIGESSRSRRAASDPFLLDRGVGVEAGIWNAPAARTLIDSGLTDHCLRILLEPAEASCNARANLLQMETMLIGARPTRLLHGMGRNAWHLVELAARCWYDTRIGFEDTLRLPDGSIAESNATLVAAARRIMASVADDQS